MGRRRVLVGIALLLAAPVAAAAAAWACTSLATIDTASPSGTVGQAIKGSGTGFDNASTNNVELHWDSRAGQILWSGRPDLNGGVNFAFAVPNSPAGGHVLIATQNSATGGPVYGTPARASFEVLSNSAAPAPATPGAAPQQPVVSPSAKPVASPSAAPAAPAGVAVAPAVAPVVAPAPAVAPAPVQAPAARRSMTVAPAAQRSLVLPLALVGIGMLLSLGTGVAVVAGRRERPAFAGRRRS